MFEVANAEKKEETKKEDKAVAAFRSESTQAIKQYESVKLCKYLNNIWRFFAEILVFTPEKVSAKNL